jgi:carbon-monoxide dehydrogenase small subunit
VVETVSLNKYEKAFSSMKRGIHLKVNGKRYDASIPVNKLLVDVLREDLGLTGTKVGCGQGECGACTVLIDGKAVCACLTLAVEVDGAAVTTIEGLAKQGKLHPLQEAFIIHGAAQCGFCTPGVVMAAKGFLDSNPHPTDEEIKGALAGNFCRCTGYAAIFRAVKSVVEGR